MRKLLSIFTFLILIVSCTATKKSIKNEATQNIKTDFTAYLDAIINQRFEESTNYILPDFFDIFPKEMMIKVMEQTFNSPEIEFDLKEPKILEIEEVQAIEGKFYSRLRYSNLMNMKFIIEDEDGDEATKEFTQNLTKASLEQTFGAENVTFNSEKNLFEIYAEKAVVAISENGKSDWKFLVIEEKQKPILEKLVPKEVLKID